MCDYDKEGWVFFRKALYVRFGGSWLGYDFWQLINDLPRKRNEPLQFHFQDDRPIWEQKSHELTTTRQLVKELAPEYYSYMTDQEIREKVYEIKNSSYKKENNEIHSNRRKEEQEEEICNL